MLPSLAAANALDTFGFSARAVGMAAAATADCDGYAGAFHNPGAVARGGPDVQAAVGYGYALTGLSINDADARVTTPRGTSLGLMVPVPLGPVQAAFGLALYMPDQFVVRIQLIPVAEPHFVLLDNNLQHIVVTPVLALRWRWLALGAGVTLLADAAGNGITFDVGLVGGEKVARGGLDVSLPIRAAPVAGVVVEPVKGLRLGLAYRGQIDLALKLDILAHVDIAGAVKGDTLITLRAFNFFTPERVSLGASWDLAPSLTLSADLAWVHWSAFRGGTPDLRILLNLGVTPALLNAYFPADHFRDVVVPRLGAEWRRPVGGAVFAARAGYAFERSPVPDQVGLTSFADSDRHIFSLGGGVVTPKLPVLPQPLRIDAAVQWHELAPRLTMKDPNVLPGSGFTSSGRMVLVTATVEARF